MNSADFLIPALLYIKRGHRTFLSDNQPPHALSYLPSTHQSLVKMASEKNDLVPSALAALPTLSNDVRDRDRDELELDIDNDNDTASKHEDHEPVIPKSEAAIPLKYRLAALAMVLFISTGTAFAEVTMGPLKSTLQRELKLNSESRCPDVALCDPSPFSVDRWPLADGGRYSIRYHQYG